MTCASFPLLSDCLNSCLFSALEKGLCSTIRQHVFYEQVIVMMCSWHNYGSKKTRVGGLVIIVETNLLLWHTNNILYKNTLYVWSFFCEVLDMVRVCLHKTEVTWNSQLNSKIHSRPRLVSSNVTNKTEGLHWDWFTNCLNMILCHVTL